MLRILKQFVVGGEVGGERDQPLAYLHKLRYKGWKNKKVPSWNNNMIGYCGEEENVKTNDFLYFLSHQK